MRKLATVVLTLLLLASVTGLIAPQLKAAKVGIGILIDLSHGQTAGGIVEMMKMIPEAYWVVLLSSEADLGILPDYVKNNAEIRYGGFTPTTLKGVEMVIIGQALRLVTPEEISALASWFNSTPRAIWLAGDSDYPAQGSEMAQQVVNMVAEALGSHLRIDYVSVEDTISNAKATYRVVGTVDPDSEVAELGYGVKSALFHGPGPLAAVLDNGTWVNPINVKIPNVYVVARTTEGGKIVEHQPKAPGAPGMIHQLYSPGDTGVFPLLAVEILPNGNKVIVSGESPYSGYQSGLTYVYYGVIMQGMRLFRNIVLWATGYYGELLAYKELLEGKKALTELISEVQELGSKLNQLTSNVNSLSNSVSSLQNTVTNIQSSVTTLEGTASDLSSRVLSLEGATANITTSMALGGVALILALISLVLVFMKKK
ncbi:MAG: hypothetical protein QN229_07085 [Desulfurococcaceae archaeon TW002]